MKRLKTSRKKRRSKRSNLMSDSSSHLAQTKILSLKKPHPKLMKGQSGRELLSLSLRNLLHQRNRSLRSKTSQERKINPFGL